MKIHMKLARIIFTTVSLFSLAACIHDDFNVIEKHALQQLQLAGTTIEIRGIEKILIDNKKMLSPDGRIALARIWFHDFTTNKRQERILKLIDQDTKQHAQAAFLKFLLITEVNNSHQKKQESFELSKRAALLGFAPAMLFYAADISTYDPVQAKEIYLKSAKLGCPIANLYWYSLINKKTEITSEEFQYKLAHTDSAIAQEFMAVAMEQDGLADEAAYWQRLTTQTRKTHRDKNNLPILNFYKYCQYD